MVKIGTSSQIILWIATGIIATTIDLLTSSLLFVWFTIGCIGALIAIILGYPFSIQVITFLSISIIFLVIGYPLAKETLNRSVDKTITMEEGYLGRIIVAKEDIKEKSMMKIDGIYWTIKNEGGMIRKGEKANIIKIDGNKLIIKKFKEDENDG